jgi:Universal stress protein family
VSRAAQAAPDIAVYAEMRPGHAAAELLRLAADDAEVVVGHRGSGGFGDLLLGSVGAALAAHSTGPVVIVRPARKPDGPVLVGLDGSDRSPGVLDYAVRRAERHGVSVQALHAFRDPLAAASGLAVPLP